MPSVVPFVLFDNSSSKDFQFERQLENKNTTKTPKKKTKILNKRTMLLELSLCILQT